MMRKFQAISPRALVAMLERDRRFLPFLFTVMVELWLGKQIAMKMRSRKHDVSSGWFWPWREKIGWMVGAALIGGGLVAQHYREEREDLLDQKARRRAPCASAEGTLRTDRACAVVGERQSLNN
jgi:hypothetical protein